MKARTLLVLSALVACSDDASPSLDGGTRRAIDIREGDSIDEAAFKALIRSAVERNLSGGAA